MAKRRQCASCGTYNAAEAKECKDCGTVFRAGYEAKKSQATTCAYEHLGRPCGYRGVMSHGTNGDGAWYCREHWDELQGLPARVHGNELPWREIKPGAAAWQYSGWDVERRRFVEARIEQPRHEDMAA